MNNYIAEYNDMVIALAAEYSRKYSMLERDDIAQELWVWFVGHPRKYKEWSELEQKDRDKLIAKSLRNAAITYCEYEKAKKIGYDRSDLYYYDPSVVEAFLPSIISESYTIPVKIQDLNSKFGSDDVTDGNNWLALRSDIASSYYKLSEAKQNVFWTRLSYADISTISIFQRECLWGMKGLDRASSSQVDSGVGDDPKSSKPIDANASNDEIFALAA